MSLINAISIAGTGMTAQSVRLNVIASNLSNQDSVASKEEDAYHARYPVFSTIMQEENASDSMQQAAGGVRIDDVIQSQTPMRREYQPDNPISDDDGYIYMTNVNPVEQMADMLSASRSYQDNVQVIETAKNLVIHTLQSMED